MDLFQFKIFVRLISILIRAVISPEDPAGRLIQSLTVVEADIVEHYSEPWITKGE